MSAKLGKKLGPAMGQAAKPTKLQQLCVDVADKIVRWNKASKSATDVQKGAPVTVVCVSDTHNLQPVIPDGDILIHAGDLSQKGSFDEIQAQLKWLSSQPHSHKIAIAGNHDLLLDQEFCDQIPHRDPSEPGKTRDDLDWGSVVYLHNTECTVEVNGRSFRIWGCPLTPQFGTWAFQYPSIRDVWSGAVPVGTDILVTHGPPKLYLDNGGKGDCNLLDEMHRVKPMLSVFGHIHTGYGREELLHSDKQKSWEDVKLGRGGVWTVASMLGQGLWPEKDIESSAKTQLVNAAISQAGPPSEAHVVQL